MDERLLNILFWGVCVGGTIIALIVGAIAGRKQLQQDIAKQKEAETELLESDFTVTTIKATVLEQTCCVKTVGIRTPKTIREFSVIFQTETGEILKFIVPEEMYDGFVQGQTGILSYVDGELYGFELDEMALDC